MVPPHMPYSSKHCANMKIVAVGFLGLQVFRLDTAFIFPI